MTSSGRSDPFHDLTTRSVKSLPGKAPLLSLYGQGTGPSRASVIETRTTVTAPEKRSLVDIEAHLASATSVSKASNRRQTYRTRTLTLALSGRLTRFQARGRRTMAGAPDARRSEGSHGPLERVVRPHDDHLAASVLCSCARPSRGRARVYRLPFARFNCADVLKRRPVARIAGLISYQTVCN